MANTKISALSSLANPTGSEEFVYAYNNTNGKVTLNTMKSFIGGGGGGSITTLNADANIWELAEGFYESEYKLFYKSGEDITNKGTLWDVKTLIFVVTNADGGKGYFAFGEKNANGSYLTYSSFGYSKSSSEGEWKPLNRRDEALLQYGIYVNITWQSGIQSLAGDSLTQIIEGISGTDYLTVSTGYPPYPGLTYTVFVNSVAAGQNYTIDLGTGVTNPLNIALPTSSTKKCVITCLITSTTTAVVTGCTIEA